MDRDQLLMASVRHNIRDIEIKLKKYRGIAIEVDSHESECYESLQHRLQQYKDLLVSMRTEAALVDMFNKTKGSSNE